jgi:suppressor for copper-sensitivity B
VIAGILIGTLASVAIMAERQSDPVSVSGQVVSWRPFAATDVNALVRSGRTVFVDVGAAWCATCKVNESLVLDSTPIRQRLASDVEPIRADWTRPDKAITTYLRSFGRYGVPFNVVFGPGAPEGIVLPELLTQQAVLDALDAAANTRSEP